MVFVYKQSALLAGAFVALLGAQPAMAATIDFTPDPATSSVTVTQTATGFLCGTTCGVKASLALPSTTYTIGNGTSATINFVALLNPSFYATSTFTLAATLGFAGVDPFTVSANASGTETTLFGAFTAGSLTWSTAPQVITLADGSTVRVAFNPVAAFSGNTVTATATLTGVNIVTPPPPAPVPLPASGLLYVAGLCGFAAMKRRKRA
ncbi:hypothetical protein GALL_437270 [mine drainage metagenome]|uniref:PEP-CTERM protein-sorting domain-containing protein n=1 Tax=mine drainage metagenome TaxID=410659 RepID=A0A1J5PU06_9ZZZZ